MGVKVPKYIRKRMNEILALNRRAAYEMEQLEEWLESKGIDTIKLRDGSGVGLEELEYGNDIIDELCERIEHFETWRP